MPEDRKSRRRQRRRIPACDRIGAALGEAYWSLANLKTFRFSAATSQRCTGLLRAADLADEDRLHFEFALGKALRMRSLRGVLRHYAEGNALRRKQQPYNAAETRFVGR